MIVFVLLYALGWATHLMSQAQASVLSRSNGLDNVRQWLRLNAHVILVRVVLGAASFMLWVENPNLFGDMLGRLLPMTHATCIFAGFCVDSIMDKATYIAGIKVEIPFLVPPTAPPKEEVTEHVG